MSSLKTIFSRWGGVGDSRGGRKPVVVKLNPECRYTIGIDFLVDSVKIVIFNFFHGNSSYGRV